MCVCVCVFIYFPPGWCACLCVLTPWAARPTDGFSIRTGSGLLPLPVQITASPWIRFHRTQRHAHTHTRASAIWVMGLFLQSWFICCPCTFYVRVNSACVNATCYFRTSRLSNNRRLMLVHLHSLTFRFSLPVSSLFLMRSNFSSVCKKKCRHS